MNDYPDWMRVLEVRGEGETTGEHLVRIVRAHDGVSLTHERERLEQLFRATESETRAALVATWKTNCASSAIAFLGLAGLDPDSKLLLGLRVGAAMTVLREACAKARLPGTQWRKLGPGWLMVYWSGIGNDAHVEWCLSTPDAVGVADHGGGGRSANAITCGRGSILSMVGQNGGPRRTLQEIYDPEKLGLVEATGDDPYCGLSSGSGSS